MSFIGAALCVLLFSSPAQPGVKLAEKRIAAHRIPEELLVGSSETFRALQTRVARRHANVWAERSLASTLTNPVTGGTWSREVGTAILDAIAALPPEQRALGVQGLTVQQVFTNYCEPALLDVPLQHDNEPFEARYRVEPYVWMTAPAASLYALSSTCTDALLRTNGTIDDAVGAGCSGEDEAAHFPDPSACRTCLAIDGDHTRCVVDGACRFEMNRELAVGAEYHDVLEATVLACAPDIPAPMMLLVEELGENNRVPAAFEHTIKQSCSFHWNPGLGELRPFCTDAFNGINIGMADVLAGWVEYIRRPGDTNTPYFDRTFLAASVEADGFLWEATVLHPGTLAEVSVGDMTIGGWGFNPQLLRPDGTDPANVDHTYAREWVGAIALKTTTNIQGVPIGVYNRNICRDEQWRGPDRWDRYFCRPDFFDENTAPPDPTRWSYDWGAFLIFGPVDTVEVIHGVTLAATGYMDATIPGGHVPEIQGSPLLADPEWENCAWPKQFEPDEMANRDTVENHETFTSQTYRFGKDPKNDIRVVLATSWRRAFCFEPLADR